jgi:hypothetical protein
MSWHAVGKAAQSDKNGMVNGEIAHTKRIDPDPEQQSQILCVASNEQIAGFRQIEAPLFTVNFLGAERDREMMGPFR